MDGEGGSNGGIDGMLNGKITLGPREASASVDLTDRVHLLPCVIKHDGACPVSHYFKPRKSDMVADGLTVEEAFFRGRKLQGVTLPIPNGYRGYVLEKKKIREGRCSEVAEGEANNWASRAEFQNITYWNHDILPSKHDPIVRSFHWFSVSDAEVKAWSLRTSYNFQEGLITLGTYISVIVDDPDDSNVDPFTPFSMNMKVSNQEENLR